MKKIVSIAVICVVALIVIMMLGPFFIVREGEQAVEEDDGVVEGLAPMVPIRLREIREILPALIVAFEGDLGGFGGGAADGEEAAIGELDFQEEDEVGEQLGFPPEEVILEIGRASCRERV